MKVYNLNVNKIRNADADGVSAEEMDNMLQETQDGDVEDYFDASFGDPLLEDNLNTSKNCSGNDNPLDDYMMHDMIGGQVAVDPQATTLDFLENSPPSINEIIAGNEDVIAHLDLIKERYQKFSRDMVFLRNSYTETLRAGGISTAEIEMLNLRMELTTKAIAKCESQMTELLKLETKMDELYKKELTLGKDLNNDGWLGKRYTAGSYLIKKQDDGTIILIDAVSKTAIPCPHLDPDYKPQLTTDDSLKKVDPADADNYNHKIIEENGKFVHEDQDVDLFLKINEEALNSSYEDNYLGVFCDLGIPQTMWVEKSNDDSMDPYKIVEDRNGELRYSAYGNWTDEGGIQQKIPADLANFMQVDVTNVVLRSEPNGLSDSNYTEETCDWNPNLFNQYIELYNNETLISRIRIEGTEPSAESPLATETDEGSYISASTVSFAFHGDRRVSPLQIDADKWVSTGRHIAGTATELAGQLGLELPESRDSIEGKAFYETFDAFTKESHNIKYFDHKSTKWADEPLKFDFGKYYDGSKDCYLPPSEVDASNNPGFEFRTGIIVHDTRGCITGTAYNDIIHTIGANDKTSYAEEKTIDNLQRIKSTDALYSNIVDAGGGNDIVVAGAGDNYIRNATFVSVESGNKDDTFISLPDRERTSNSIQSLAGSNPKTYVRIRGGRKTFIANPDEMQMSDYGDDEQSGGKDEIEAHDGAYNDDYFDVEGAANYQFVPRDEERSAVAVGTSGQFDLVNFNDQMNTARSNMEDELNKEPEIDDEMIDATWEEVMGQKTMLDDEMNSFFGEMFGWTDELLGEVEAGPFA